MHSSLKMTSSSSVMALAPQLGIVTRVHRNVIVTLYVFQIEVCTVLQHCMNKASSLLDF